MNAFTKLLSVGILIGSLMGSVNPPQAGAQPGLAPASSPVAQTQGVEYLLVMELPAADSMAIPENLSPIQVRRVAAAWANRQAQPVLEALNGLRVQGVVQGFAFDSQEWVLRVRLAEGTPDVLAKLAALPTVAQVLPGEATAGLQVGYSQALREIFYQASLQVAPEVDRPDMTDPSIYVFAMEGNPYTYLRGMTLPNIPVALSARRGTALLFSQTVISDSGGVYQLEPERIAGVYSWQLLPGDVVTASAHGSTVSTTVARLTAWIDPVQDAMIGVTAPGRSLLAWVNWEKLVSPCNPEIGGSMKSGTSSSDGSFQVDFSDIDLLHGAWGSVEVYDGNHNMTWGMVNAFWMHVDLTSNDTMLYFVPNQALELVLEQSSGITETLSGTAEYDGWFDIHWVNQLQTEDVIFVTSGDWTMTYSVLPVSLTVDPQTNMISGITEPYGEVMIQSSKPSPGSYAAYQLGFPTTCSVTSACLDTTSNGAGEFALSNPFDLGRGDALELQVWDGSGNSQINLLHVPLIAIRPAYQEILGYWAAGHTPLEIEVLDGGDVLKSFLETTSSEDGYYKVAVTDVPLVPGDRVVVNGTISTPDVMTTTLSMQVPEFTALIHSNGDHLTGNAPPGSLLLQYLDYQPATNTNTSTCKFKTTAGGEYDFDLTQQGIEGGDQGWVYSQGADGHISEAYSHGFQIMVEIDTGLVSGYTPEPGTPLTVVLLDDAGEIESRAIISTGLGYYYQYLVTHPLLPGQRVRIWVGENFSEVVLPPVTVEMDAATNRIYGLSAPLQHGVASLYQWYDNDGNTARSIHKLFTADSAGMYSVSFEGLTWWDCSEMVAGGQCTQARMKYTTLEEEYVVALNGPRPLPVPPDLYEADNSLQDAHAYVFISEHTFHDALDVDWVLLEVTEADLGKTIIIETFNLGLMADTVLWLYDHRGDDLMHDDDGGTGRGSRIQFAPAAAGMYYVEVVPYDADENTGNCGATYTLLISRDQVYMPVINR